LFFFQDNNSNSQLTLKLVGQKSVVCVSAAFFLPAKRNLHPELRVNGSVKPAAQQPWASVRSKSHGEGFGSILGLMGREAQVNRHHFSSSRSSSLQKIWDGSVNRTVRTKSFSDLMMSCIYYM
jgi:hypothetical protein